MSSTAIANELIRERARQVKEEGWTNEHDDQHPQGALERAAATYAFGASIKEEWRPWLITTHKTGRPAQGFHIIDVVRNLWPWSFEWWKPEGKTARRMLVIAGALIIAAIERIDRNTAEKEAAEGEGG